MLCFTCALLQMLTSVVPRYTCVRAQVCSVTIHLAATCVFVTHLATTWLLITSPVWVRYKYNLQDIGQYAYISIT